MGSVSIASVLSYLLRTRREHISHLLILIMRACVLFLAFGAVALAEVFLDERFADGDAWEKRWIQSTNKGETAGKFVLTHGKFYGDAEKDLGIQTSQDARFFGLSTKFQAFSNKDSPVVIQFTVKHKQNIDWWWLRQAFRLQSAPGRYARRIPLPYDVWPWYLRTLKQESPCYLQLQGTKPFDQERN